MRTFDNEWHEAGVAFVSAGTTLDGKDPDSDPEITHVDTGRGRFDHHQLTDRTCAAKIVYQYLAEKYEYIAEDEALARLVEVIVDDDHFEECDWPEANSDRYSFMFGDILDGLKRLNMVTDQGLIDLGSTCLDGIYHSLKLKIGAEKELEEGIEFETKWGKAIGVESKNDEVITVGLKGEYVLVVRKDPEGMIRIKTKPRSSADLTEVWERVRAKEPDKTWFLHMSKKMLLNGSYKNPEHVRSELGLREIIGIIQNSKLKSQNQK